jgi:hypothetical protein
MPYVSFPFWDKKKISMGVQGERLIVGIQPTWEVRTSEIRRLRSDNQFLFAQSDTFRSGIEVICEWEIAGPLASSTVADNNCLF